jgi:hypothetical protein
LIYEQGLSHQKGDPPFLSLNKAGFGFSLYEGEARKAIGSREVSMNPEITNSPQSSATNEFQNKELSDLENTRLSKEKPRYHLGKIYLTKDNHDPSLSFISRLSAVEGEEKNPLFRALENSRGNGIFKSLAIFWELELNF